MATTLLRLAAGAVLSLVMLSMTGAQEAKPRLITVSGESEVKVMPDQAVITIGVETLDKSIDEAKSQNDKQVRDVTEIARAAGVKDGDVATEYISVDTRFERPYEEKRFIGYSVRRRIVITLNDMSKFESLLASLLSGGVDEIQSVQFLTTESRKYKDQARAMAIKAAREKAQAMAAELGMALGEPYSIEEKSGSMRSWYGGWGWGRNYPNPFNSSANAEPSMPTNGESPLALGKISVSAGVSVSFEIKDITP